MPETKTIVILGGSLGGLGVAHRLLKYTLPKNKHLKVILVSRSSHFYWNLGSTRAVIPGIIKDDEILQPIEPGLAKYPQDSVEFIIGVATSVDAASKTATISLSSSSSDIRTISYDFLVLATGANPADTRMPWKASGSYTACLASLHDTATRIKASSHIVIAGAGATGVELAGEIRYEYKDKDVVLLSASEALIGGDSTASCVEKELSKQLGVIIKKNVRATDVTEKDGKTHLTLSNGETLVTDFYIPTTGLTPNTSYLPSEFLTEHRFVDVDEYFQVRAARDIWAVGDVVSKPRASFLNTEAQAEGVVKNLDLVLQHKDQVVVKGPLVDAYLFAMGRSRGVGRLGQIPVPSILVWAFKGRTLGLERTKKYVDGTMW